MTAKLQHDWSTFLAFYTKQNKGRSTRLGVFDAQSAPVTDYWLEARLAFDGVDIDTRGEMPAIQIMLKDFQHVVGAVKSLKAHFSFAGDEDGLDITDSEGLTTILRFES